MAIKTNKAFLDDPYLTACEGKVVGLNERGGILLDTTNFYATSGGQPGDRGTLELENGDHVEITVAVCGENKNEIVLVPEEGQTLPKIGATVIGHIDWERRYDLMRMHTACHLLSVVCPYPITSANVNEIDSRVDFDIPSELMGTEITKELITEKMMALIEANHPVFTQWISEQQLEDNPDIVRSKNVRPPKGLGDIRLVCIGEESSIDSQPCGGTHVSETQEVGQIYISKIENKGKENRRFRMRFGSAV